MGTPDFIRELRGRIGTALLWLSGAQCVIYRTEAGEPRFLLVQRADLKFWDHVAGIVEPGEHPEATIVREAAEEACVTVSVGQLLRIQVNDPVTYSNGDVCQFLDHVYLARWEHGEAAVGDDESLAVGWFPADALPSPLGPSTRELIDIAKDAL